MKTRQFRLSFSVSSARPAAFSHENWPRERSAVLLAFRPIAERYRRRRRTVLCLFGGFMLAGFVIVYVNLPEAVKFWGFIFMMAAWFGTVIALLFRVKLICPACKSRLAPAKGVYCPQCGSDQFQHGFYRNAAHAGIDPYCPSCHGRIAEEDADNDRSYRIRGCTHCGVMLDDVGV